MSDHIQQGQQQRASTPLLFLVFNRPDTTKQVFKAIRQAKPAKLYIAADGPRPEKEGEEEIVQEVRSIATNVDWDCEVKTLFRDQNLGCKVAVSSAITWFFKHEEEGIILEDDCLPNQSFFRFCEQMLSEYRNDERIMMISGANYLFNNNHNCGDYFFSRYFAIWGWATWKRAWNKYDIFMEDWPEYRTRGYLESIFGNEDISFFFTRMFDQIYEQRIDTWDLQWVYSCIFNYALSIVSTKNLVSNIGISGTHNDNTKKNSIFLNMPRCEIANNVCRSREKVFPNSELEKITFSNIGITKKKKNHAAIGRIIDIIVKKYKINTY